MNPDHSAVSFYIPLYPTIIPYHLPILLYTNSLPPSELIIVPVMK